MVKDGDVMNFLFNV
ncbi:TPA: hypothetical protein MX372_000264 [Enterobacter roggenkampii]|nr:hypothetical protein [Enterobacter roggenkampii]EKU9175166.1 hypothetical protein [Enterobacter roggenkampii MGH 34]MBO2915955.1 hypothetical protein [Enterobacter sichuanensis]MBW9389623.1 hypothetical protein [Enterobacter sp. EC_62]MBW9446431.1 hypothetical protein [Enterobacter sp. EC_50]MCA2028786.1 hypothetical protein [Enterobacter sp. K16B]MCC4747397.1 hypothetical protein [Escherichia coli]MCX4181188.1 hypothetical protein [Enterobacter sp. HSTU-ASh6]RWT50326.1 hypothetical prot